jgi:hypothetical protein
MKKNKKITNNQKNIVLFFIGFLILGLVIGVLFSNTIATTGQAKSAVVPAPQISLALYGDMALNQIYSNEENGFKEFLNYYINYSLLSNIPADSGLSICLSGGTYDNLYDVCTNSGATLRAHFNPNIGGYYQNGTTTGSFKIDDYNPFADAFVTGDLKFSSGQKKTISKSIQFNSNQDPFAKVTALEITENGRYYLSHTNVGEINIVSFNLQIFNPEDNFQSFSWDAVSIGNNSYAGVVPNELVDILNNASGSLDFVVTSFIITGTGNATISTKFFVLDSSTKKTRYLTDYEIEKIDKKNYLDSEKLFDDLSNYKKK